MLFFLPNTVICNVTVYPIVSSGPSGESKRLAGAKTTVGFEEKLVVQKHGHGVNVDLCKGGRIETSIFSKVRRTITYQYRIETCFNCESF